MDTYSLTFFYFFN